MIEYRLFINFFGLEKKLIVYEIAINKIKLFNLISLALADSQK